MRKLNYVPNMCDASTLTEHAAHFNVAAVQTETPLLLEASTQTIRKKKGPSVPGSTFTLNAPATPKLTRNHTKDVSANPEEDQLISDDSSEGSMEDTNPILTSRGVSKHTTQLDLDEEEGGGSQKDFSLQDIEVFAKKMVPTKQSRFKKYSKEHSMEPDSGFSTALNRQSSLLSFGNSPNSTPKLGPKGMTVGPDEELARMGKQLQSLIVSYKEVVKERDALRGSVRTMISNKIADRIKSKFIGGSSLSNLLSPAPQNNSRPSSPRTIVLLPPISPHNDDQEEVGDPINKHLMRVRKSNMVRASARDIRAVSERKEVDVKVIKQAKFRKDHQIRLANKLMTSFLDAKTASSNANISCLTAGGTISKINQIYHNFFSDVEKKKENLTLRLFIYTYKFYSNKTSDTMAEGYFKRLLKSLQVHLKTPRAVLFSGFLGLKQTLDVHSFQIFYEICKHLRDRHKFDAIKDFKDKDENNFYVPSSFMLDAIGNVLSRYLPFNEVEAVKQSMHNREIKKRFDSHNSVYNFDFEMSRILLLTKNVRNATPHSLFYNADINGDGTLEFDEFRRILTCFEPEYFWKNRSRLQEIFLQYADQEDDGERVISNHRFVEMGQNLRLFGKESHENFMKRASTKGFVRSLPDLLNNWKAIQAMIVERLDSIWDENNQKIVEIFFSSLERDIVNYDEMQKDKIWINYKILENYVNEVYTLSVVGDMFIPKELTKIEREYKLMETWNRSESVMQ